MKKLNLKIVSYVLILSSIAIVAGLGSLFVSLGMEWFSTLITPSEFVPSFIIPIVWSVIYIIFAITLCVLTTSDKLSTKTIVLLVINGILNLLWCLLFFTLNSTLWGYISIVLLLISTFVLVIDLLRYNRWYLYLTIIYPIWVSIATGLNLSLWILN